MPAKIRVLCKRSSPFYSYPPQSPSSSAKIACDIST